MEDKKILAADARTIADSTAAFSNHIYKEIREAAKEGMTQIEWSVYPISLVLLDRAITDLKEAGYKVELEKEEETDKVYSLIINW